MAYLGTPIDTTNTFQSLQGKRFSGDGSTTAFTLDIIPSSVFDIEVFVENVRQDPNSAYGISGTTLTFTGAPPSGTNNIYVVHQAKAVGTIDVPASSVVPASLASNIISGQTALAANPATDDELLISDAGTIKRIDAQFFQNTPAFLAHKTDGNQSISSDTATLITFNTEVFDSDGKYASNRFTPTIAGKYMIGCSLRNVSVSSAATLFLMIRKNGSERLAVITRPDSNGGDAGSQLHGIIEMDDNDYVEIFLDSSDSSATIKSGSNLESYFYGYKLIGV